MHTPITSVTQYWYLSYRLASGYRASAHLAAIPHTTLMLGYTSGQGYVLASQTPCIQSGEERKELKCYRCLSHGSHTQALDSIEHTGTCVHVHHAQLKAHTTDTHKNNIKTTTTTTTAKTYVLILSSCSRGLSLSHRQTFIHGHSHTHTRHT